VRSRDVIGDYCVPGASADLADLMRELSREGRLAGIEVSERFYEGGSPEGLRDLEHYLSSSAAS
jgi:hypothetical protein